MSNEFDFKNNLNKCIQIGGEKFSTNPSNTNMSATSRAPS